MEPLIKASTLRLAAKIAEFADNGEKVEVLRYTTIALLMGNGL